MNVTLVDAHAHYYECFSLQHFLEAARRNFTAEGRRLGLSSEPHGCLLLAGAGGSSSLGGIRQRASSLPAAWRLEPTGEPDSLVAMRNGRVTMTLIAGRQTVTSEGLEMLALATDRDVGNGRSLRESARVIADTEGIAVVPWGLGKWWFRRGQTLRRFLRTYTTAELPHIYLADNGGRAGLWGKPKMLRWAMRQGIRVLAGSDPLPLGYQLQRIASYGFVLGKAIDIERPAGWIRQELQGPTEQPAFFGGCNSVSGFLRDQAALRIKKGVR